MVKKLFKLIKLTVEIAYRDSHLWECTDWNKTKEMKKEAKEIIDSFLLVKLFDSL